MLDVLSGALGAFLIIMIVLFPYYNKEAIDYQREIQVLTQQLNAAREDIEETQAQLESVEQQLEKTFLLIHISWEPPVSG